MKRIINYPTRGIGKTTVDRIIEFSVLNNETTWEVIQKINTLPVGINSGIRDKVFEFGKMVRSWQIMLADHSAYELASHISSACGILTELYNDRTPEGVNHYENVQALLNGIKEFSEDGKIPLESPSAEHALPDLRTLDLYLQDIALLTDADNEKDGDDNKVSLMTIHSAKGLEFKHVHIVGLEENLFPSQLSVNSRTELEEERRLFYVAITRAEQKLTLSMAATRYRWGNLISSQPSRFLEEIDSACLDMPVQKGNALFDDVDERGGWDQFGSGNQNTHRGLSKSTGNKSYSGSQSKYSSKSNVAPKPSAPTNGNDIPKGFKKVGHASPSPIISDFKADDPSKILVGVFVEHQRFGKGQVIALEGRVPENKATILFEGQGQKQLLLKFAKLRVIES
jgi:DNA helicase-2/ATP-dependent DNA helicase PcrA